MSCARASKRCRSHRSRDVRSQFVTQDGRHEQVIDAALRGLDTYLDEHRDELHDRLAQTAPWWLPGAVEDRIFVRLLDGARAVLDAMVQDPNHELRRQLDERLEQLATDLETSPELRARGEQIKLDLLAQPELRALTSALWSDMKAVLRAQAADPDSELRRRLADAFSGAGARLQDDPALAAKVQEGVETAVGYVADHFNGEIATLVSGTVERWDAAEHRAVSNCCSAPTCNTSASTARWSADSPASPFTAIANVLH